MFFLLCLDYSCAMEKPARKKNKPIMRGDRGAYFALWKGFIAF